MKKIRSKLFLLIGVSLAIIGSLYIAPIVQASQCGGIDTGVIDCKNTDAGSIREILLITIDIMTVGVGVLGAVGITVVGIQYLTASDNVQQTTKAKRRLYEIIIGLIMYVLLYSIVQWVMPGGKLNTEEIPVESVSLVIPGSGIPDSVATGSIIRLRPVLNPIDADNHSYEWESSDISIATVDNGVVTLKKAGKVTISVTTSNKKTSSVELNVVDPPPDPEIEQPIHITPGPNSNPNSNPDSGNYHKIGNALAVAHANSYGSLTDKDIDFALRNKFWGIECDLEYDERGFMCYHPPTTQSFKSSSNPSLQKTVETCISKGIKKVVLDVKITSHFEELGNLIKQKGWEQYIVVQTNNLTAIRTLNNILGQGKIDYWGLNLTDLNSTTANIYRSAGMTAVNLQFNYSTSVISAVKSLGFDICMYTFSVFSQQEINTFNSLGVKYLMTNGSQ